MFLVYTDESGKDLNPDENGFYRDGPCFTYGGLAIDIHKHYMIEEAFKILCEEILEIKNIYETEIHTGDIFYNKGNFSKLSVTQKKEFFKEILQLLAKFNVPLISGVVYKNSGIFSENIKKIASAIYAFFHGLDSFLLHQGKHGLVIADEIEKDIKNIKEIIDEKNLKGKKGGIKLSHLLRRIYFEKFNRFKEYSLKPIIPLRYNFESKIYAIADNIHYVSSKLSLLNQLTDIVLFLLNISLECQFSKTQGNSSQEKTTIKMDLYKEIKEDLVQLFSRTESSINLIVKRSGLYDTLRIDNENLSISFETINLMKTKNLMEKIIEWSR